MLTLLALSAPALAVPSKPAVVRSGPTLPNLQWLLRTTLSSGVADISFVYGTPARGDQPVFGDWNGDSTKTPGVRRANQFLRRNSNTSENAEWDGDATDTIGVVRGARWLLRNSNTGASAQGSFADGSGAASEIPMVWR
jgi:hypothetical protein